jgi:hypothetical protein
MKTPFRLAIALNGLDHERAIAAKFCARGKALSSFLKRHDSNFEIVRRLACRKGPYSVRQSPVRGDLFLTGPHTQIGRLAG